MSSWEKSISFESFWSPVARQFRLMQLRYKINSCLHLLSDRNINWGDLGEGGEKDSKPT